MRLLLLFVLSVTLFLLCSCKKYKPAEQAFFIKANKVSVSTTSGEGTSSHKITDLWLYVNGKFEGAYPVGNLMPIVSKGSAVTINIFAGIKNNGIADTRIFYPFYKLLAYDTLVETGKTIERSFSFSYKPETKFEWSEDFEGSGFSILKSPISEVTPRKSAAGEGYEGKCIILELAGDSSIAQIESTGSGFSLPTGSSNVYLELNYKCNAEFSVGLIGDDTRLKEVFTLNPHEEWNKIYIQLSSAVSSPPVSTKYKVYFNMLKGPNIADTKRVYLDNIKLVYL